MSFFSREKSSFRGKPSKHTFDYDQRFVEMLRSSKGTFTVGNSAFTPSPYEIFRQNVAKYCEHFMYSSFDQDEFLSSEEKSLRALRTVGEPGFNERFAEGDASRHADLATSHQELVRSGDDSHGESCHGESLIYEGNNNCNCSSSIICEHCRVRPSKSDTNIFSVMSASFEPSEGSKIEKPSLLKKITHLMNSDFNSHKEKVTTPQRMPWKQRHETTKWDACECYVHIGRHSNCCQCQEPYHRTNCECVQHNGSHSYCCRCDPNLLQDYNQHLKKKRYLRLTSEDEEASPVHSIDYQDAGISRSPRSSLRTDATVTDFRSGKKLYQKIPLIPPDQNIVIKGQRSTWDHDAGESDNCHHPCESCCKKLDQIYGTALREVHNMLMDVSRTLLPSAHCCSLETRIQNVSHLWPSFSQDRSVNLETVESEVAEPEWTKDVPGTSDVGVQVTQKDLICEEKKTKKMSKGRKRLNNICVIL